MRSGALVHDSLMIKLIVGELASRGWIESRGTHAAGLASEIAKNSSDLPSASFMLDGFPRTKGQAVQLDTEISMNFVRIPRSWCCVNTSG